MTSRRRTALALLLAVSACGGQDGGGPPAEPPPANGPAAYLAPARYDCTAAGPFEPPPRPHPTSCFRDPNCAGRLVTGHRMATPFAPENSLAALRAAILLGVDIVETDVRATADGEVVLIHDGSVDRTLDGSGDVAALTLAEVLAMPMRVSPTLPAGDFSCERVPLLDDTFALARGRIVVELEVKNTAAGVASAAYLRDHDLYADAFLLCDPAECAAIRAAVPDAPIMTRPQSAGEVAAELMYDPPPLLVHVDPYESFLTAEVLAAIEAAGAKVYANAFLLADVQAIGQGSYDGYPAMFALGLDVLQTEFPHWALDGMGRLQATND